MAAVQKAPVPPGPEHLTAEQLWDLPTRTDLDAEGQALVPRAKDNYIFREELVKPMIYAIKYDQPVLLSGDAGFGKSSLVEQIAARTNTPLHRRNLHGATEPEEILGNYTTPEAGRVAFEEGFLPRAMRKGHWVLLDELDSCEQPVLFVLQMMLEDEGKLALPDPNHTIVTPHPNFRLFATANTIGRAAANRLIYSGTSRRLNEATLDRFGVVLYVEPPPEEVEREIVHANVDNFHPKICEAIVTIARQVRRAQSEGEVMCTLGPRRLIQWAKAMSAGFRPNAAAEFAVLNKLSPDDYDVVKGLIESYFKGLG